jgi:hypothetical protein
MYFNSVKLLVYLFVHCCLAAWIRNICRGAGAKVGMVMLLKLRTAPILMINLKRFYEKKLLQLLPSASSKKKLPAHGNFSAIFFPN